MEDRLARFREAIARLDPAANPRHALRERLYVDPPGGSLAQKLSAALQLAPSSTHLVVGSVGSGKSTELLATEGMATAPDTRAVYVDVGLQHDLSSDLTGVLLVLAGLAVARLVKDVKDADVQAASRAFRDWAFGYREFIPEGADDEPPEDFWNDEPGYYASRPGVLRPPVPTASWTVKERTKQLAVLKSALPEPLRHVVLLFDSLDRLADVDRFRQVVLEDLAPLRRAGIGAVVVGPSRVVYGANRAIVDRFDQLHYQPAYDASDQAPNAEFLSEVLERRVGENILPSETRALLVVRSGGILRDLIAITRGSLEEAFLAGTEQVGPEHVDRAADTFGRSMMIGLREREITKLQQLRRHGTFVPTSDDDLALLESRRVLEYRGIATRYAIHPTIEPLLAVLERTK